MVCKVDKNKLVSSDVDVKTLTTALRVVVEDVYVEAIPKATQAMMFCLSSLTRTPNKFMTPYFPS